MATKNKIVSFAVAKRMYDEVVFKIAATGRVAVNSWWGFG